MEYFDFNQTMARGDTFELLRCAGNCHSKQQYIEEEIDNLKAKLREQKDFENKLREKANSGWI